MKKFLAILCLIFICSATAMGAKYKVNTSGQITTPSGNIQNSSNILQPTQAADVYSNYYHQIYVQNNQVNANPVGTIDIVMDYSGSMTYWIEVAKRSMASIVSQLPVTTKVGFRVFGHDSGNNPYSPILNKVKCVTKNKKGKYVVATQTESYLGNISGSCSATSQIVPVTPYNALNLLNGMNSVKVGGSTPLTLALEQAVNTDFGKMDNTSSKKIVLITDGGENCGGDPCAFARKLVAQRSDITIDVVLVSSNSKELVCLANLTGGKFYNTDDVSSFTHVLQETVNSSPENTNTTPAPEQNQEYEFMGW